jgi:hypothetical protein
MMPTPPVGGRQRGMGESHVLVDVKATDHFEQAMQIAMFLLMLIR